MATKFGYLVDFWHMYNNNNKIIIIVWPPWMCIAILCLKVEQKKVCEQSLCVEKI